MISLLRKTCQLNEVLAKYSKDMIGLVPTMGNLHAGHLSLAKKSIEENPVTIVTIFVNPKQFGPNEDFSKYPRTLEQDLEKLQVLLNNYTDRKLLVFAPDSVSEIFPDGFQTSINIGGITDILCGASRPGHFAGVTTVVYQLFKLSNAQRAYFGQKDYQQVKVIQQMITDLRLDIELITLPISRDQDGLAQSSRNQYLSDAERENALKLPQTINQISTILERSSWIEAGIEINDILEAISKKDNWEYLEILDASNLLEINIKTTQVVVAGALKAGTTRLIDNKLVDINYAR